MLNWFKIKDPEMEVGKYYKVDGDNVQIKALGNGEFNIECLGNVVRFNIHAMLAEEYVKRFIKPILDAGHPYLTKTDKELLDLLGQKEDEEDWEECANIKKILDLRNEKKEGKKD
jgi:hypothetical protein